MAETESVMPKTPSVPKYMCSMMRATPYPRWPRMPGIQRPTYAYARNAIAMRRISFPSTRRAASSKSSIPAAPSHSSQPWTTPLRSTRPLKL